jgi:hypothetical protein
MPAVSLAGSARWCQHGPPGLVRAKEDEEVVTGLRAPTHVATDLRSVEKMHPALQAAHATTSVASQYKAADSTITAGSVSTHAKAISRHVLA